MTNTPVYDPTDPQFRADPYPTYARLRNEMPLAISKAGPLVVSRHSDVLRLLRSADVSRNVDESATDFAESELEARTLRRGGGGAKSMLNLDPPDHTRLRGLVSKAFTPKALAQLRPRIQQLVDDALAPARDTGTIELNSALAFPVPFQAIADMLALPTDRVEELRTWSATLTYSLEPTSTTTDAANAEAAANNMIEFLVHVIEQRRHNLGDDVLSGLLVAEESGERLSLPELISTVVLLFVAGHETTVNLIGNGAFALAKNPEQRALWRTAGESLDTNAIDELLRFDGPVQHTVRVPLVDLETTGGVLPAGRRVIALLGAANRDPELFEEPEHLQLDRKGAARHLAFSSGIHYCLGASLARLEGQIALGTMVRLFPEWDVVSPPQWRDRLIIRGIEQLQLSLR
jgi:cytochrome P450